MKIGIMGGTFDPIHNGHLMLGDYAYKNFHLNQIWFLPNGNPPHKNEKTDVSKRLEMVRLAITDDARFFLNTYEAEKASKSYSYETLEAFHTLYPEDDFYFIVGADSLFNIEFWKEPAKVMQQCTLLAACRDDKNVDDMLRQIHYLEKKYYASIQLMTSPHMDVSSSEIRHMIAKGMDIANYVPERVAEYIEEHHLYKDMNADEKNRRNSK